MKKYSIIIFGILLSFSSFSQDKNSWLQNDLVTVSGGKYTVTNYNLITLSDGTTTLQVKSYSEAPVTDISRDRFVAWFVIFMNEMFKSLNDNKEPKIKYLEESIGKPDVELAFYMNKTGVQIEIRDKNGTERETQKWSDLEKE